ncbi:hypothetical protein ACCO45_003601 [Purpureocillium lilacinum]|uniref:Uncharacterized protein n=1 Tax=Purpureocillium lilacinum TaxID=33203 RepID=A0ACC4E3I4_PURLI
MGSVLDKNSSLVRKRIEGHTFDGEDGEEYEGSEFHGFGDYFRRKKIKLQNLDADMRASSDKPQIFKGIVAHVTGYTQPPLHVLHREIVQHGGGFLQYLDSKTMATHIIASTLPPKKSVDFNRYRIVKPAWIMDSVQAGKVLPWAEYRVFDEGPRQKVLKFGEGQGLSQATPGARKGYREQTDNSFYTSQMKARAASGPSLLSQDMTQLAEKLQSPGQPENSRNLPDLQSRRDFSIGSTATDTPKLSLVSGEATAFMEAPSMDESLPDAESDSIKAALPDDGPQQAPKNMTSEEHNAWLLSDPRLRKSSTANPEFLKQFYSESRLHHLSTWKASLKSSMQRLAAEKGLSQKKIRKRPGARSYIMHVDFDSFFCAVSLKKHPEFADKPTAIAHGTGPGSEIASCNYPAREFGIKNGMWMKRALELCPDIKVLPYDFPAYEDASRLFYESIMTVGGVVQSVSIDEALIDATAVVLNTSASQGIGIDEGSMWREQEKADEIAHSLREKIRAKTGCEVSVGIGSNILQAKVALRRAKPAGQYQLKPEDVLNVIGELTVENLPGVSYSTGGKLEELGVKFVKDIREVSRERLTSALGPKTGEKLAEYARGIDRSEVGEQPPRKSVSAEVNWGIRFISQPEAEEFVYNLCKELEKRLLAEQVKGKHLTMKIMRRSLDAPLDPAKHLGHGRCDTFNKSSTFGVATHSYEVIGKEAVSILRSFNLERSQGLLRRRNMRRWSKSMNQRVRRNEALSVGVDDDPITEDPLTPRKLKVHPAMALSRASAGDAKANTPLNVSGTQFIIPSNADPAVLAELPSDIRSKLMAQRSKGSASRADSGSASPQGDALIPSQVDAEVFNALPDDMKAEILATYGRRPATPSRAQSPRKDVLAQPRKQTTPSKRGGIRGLFGKAQRQRDAQAGVIQTSFKPLKRGDETPTEGEIEELDPDFLAELPEDVRKEVIDDHRRRRLAQRSGLNAPSRRHHGIDTEAALPGGQRRIQFPAPPPKLGVTSTREIKDMLDAWHDETRSDGPHSGDVEVFEKYLTRVVLEERDLEKVVVLMRWLALIVEQDGQSGRGLEEWRRARDQVEEAVQAAVKQRGLAPLRFD